MSNAIIKKYKIIIFIPVVFGVISLLITYFRLQSNESFIANWLPFYLVGLLIIAPLAFFIFKAIDILLNKHLKIKNIYINGICFGILMSGSVGVLLSTALVVLSNDYTTLSEFIIKWKETVYSFLTRIIILGPLVGGIVKPLIQKRRIKNRPQT
ncbi:hypothetical protein [Aquimarina sp. 2201CG5-10]|uniref:hypothetical protein n=1 Tax=Aquimarina callyspongiae TaxID=3098150 RepID=UPI002AB3CA54|nr:hypothetical protein [Aquimarina sp. 2201CG5-10]MDY8135381.1 hypothetical protein [Aquimarina sp. 2201CG5-10]